MYVEGVSSTDLSGYVAQALGRSGASRGELDPILDSQNSVCPDCKPDSAQEVDQEPQATEATGLNLGNSKMGFLLSTPQKTSPYFCIQEGRNLKGTGAVSGDRIMSRKDKFVDLTDDEIPAARPANPSRFVACI